MWHSRPFIRTERAVDWADLAVAGLLVALFYSLMMVAREWAGPMQAPNEIHLSVGHLPLYALFSLTRGLLAYALSFLFTLGYGYVMARVRGAERLMLPVLDILQSIPVLGFLPSFVIGLVHLFPDRNIGLEIASVLMIFTGQVWNMTFSFYSSLKSVPADLVAVTRLAKMSSWQRFLRLDLSYAATGLVWNSMMSMAGGWFFLTVSEAFVLGEHDFRLPGLGSFMSLAIEQGDVRAQIMGVTAMLTMIVCLDQLLWRPVVAWAQKFTDEETGSASESWLWEKLRTSSLWRWLTRNAGKAIEKSTPSIPAAGLTIIYDDQTRKWVFKAAGCVAVACAAYGVFSYVKLLTTLTFAEWLHLAGSAATTFLRVLLAVAMATLWTVPVGVAIGRSPRAARVLQPVIQMAASFPAPMIFPVVVGGMLALGFGLGVSSVFLLVLGTQWYILFNVIAGSSAIPKDLWEFSRLARFSSVRRWKILILPAIFPQLLTGWITATGGAWNASIVAEYMKYRSQTLTTTGLGAAISVATEKGDFHVLAAAVGIMAVTVVGFNRMVWRPLSHHAQTKYSLLS